MPRDVSTMKSYRWTLALSLVGITACSHPQDSQLPADAAVDDAHVDPITEDVFRVGCAGHTTAASTYALPPSQVGQTVNLRLELPPHSIPVTSFATEGPDAPAFSGLLDDFGNAVAVFKPTQARAYSATVIAMTAGGPLARIALTGAAVAQSGPLVFRSPFAEVGFDPFDNSLLVLTNTSTTSAVRLDRVLVETDDQISDVGIFGCPPTLQPMEECVIGIGPLGSLGSKLGCRRDTITVSSDANTATADVFVSIKSDVSLAFAHGTISSNTNQSCTGSCTLRFVDGPVTLTATPDAGYRFVGWNGTTGCTTDPICTLRNNTGYLNEVRPLFVPTSFPQVSITFAGTGQGHVLAFSGIGEPVVCDRSCMISATSATESVFLVAASTSRFIGWAGACRGPSIECNLGTATQDRSVTVTFDKDAMEVATLSPPDDARMVAFGAKYSAGFLANGDIVVSSGTTITRMTTAGVVVWTRRANATELVVTPNGTIVYLNDWYILFALDASGAPLWRKEVPVRPSGSGLYFEGRRLAVTPSGDIATMLVGFLGTFSATNGAELWSTTENDGNAIAVDTAGHIAVGISDGLTALVHRYTSDGTRILPDWDLPGGSSTYTELAFDASGGLVVLTSAGSSILRRFDANGTPVFQQAAPEHQLMTVEGDNILTLGFSGPNQGLGMTVTSLTGTPRPGVTKPFLSTTRVSFRVWPGGLATDGAGRVALLGTDAMHGGTFLESINYQWVELLQLP